MPLQYFALDSTHVDYPAVRAALVTANAANLSYTPTLVERPCSHSSDIKIVAANMEEGNLTGDLAVLNADNYPNALCRHRFPSRAAARLQAFHMLGESIRSYEKVAGRKVRFIRPMLANTSLNYGAGNGTTHYDAFNGARDTAIGVDDDGGVAANRHRTGRTYFWCFGAHHVIGIGQNPGDDSATPPEGRIYMEDATGLGEAGAIRVRCDDPMRPALALGGGATRHEGSGLPWEEYTLGIFVNGAFNDSGTSGIGQTDVRPEADIEDVTVSETTLRMRHMLKGKANLSDLNGTGGRGRYYAQASAPTDDALAACLTFNGTSYIDHTFAANDATTGDVPVVAAGDPDGAGILLGFTSPFSNVRGVMSTLGSGTYTGEWVYGTGAGTWGSLTNILDVQNNWKAHFSGPGLGDGARFNLKSDWVVSTVDGVGPYYWLFWRKTGGTVSTGPVAARLGVRRRAVFVHRWNDTAPIKGMLRHQGGLRYVTATQGTGSPPQEITNFEMVNFRAFFMSAFVETIGNTEGLIVKGSQIIVYGGLQTTTGHRRLTFTYSDPEVDGGGIFWDRSDIGVIGIGHPFFQDILAEPDADQTKFRENEWWSDLVGCNGAGALYQSAAGSWHLTINGLRIRKTGVNLDLLNDPGGLVMFTGGGDNHCLGFHGSYDDTTVDVQQVGIEEHIQAITFYCLGEGGRNEPIEGSGGSIKNIHLRYGYHWKWNGSVGSGAQPAPSASCINFIGDNDTGSPYENGTGLCSNNRVSYWYMFDEGANHCPGVNTTHEGEGAVAGLTVRHCVFDGKSLAFSTGKNFDESCHAIRLDPTGPTYIDFTNNVKESGNTATILFPTGALGEKLYLGVSTRLFRRFRFNISTAGVGTAALTWRYWNGSAFVAVSGLSDATSNFKTSGNDRAVSFNRPADAALVTVNGQQRYWVEVEITSGSYTTVPQADQVLGRRPGASIDIQHYKVRNIPTNGYIGRTFGAFWYDEASWMIDNHATIELSPGQDENTLFYRTVSNSGNPNMDLATWQAQAAFKAKETCDAEVDSVMGPNNQFIT